MRSPRAYFEAQEDGQGYADYLDANADHEAEADHAADVWERRQDSAWE